MDKRTFLKTSSVLLAGGLLSPLVSCEVAEEQPEKAAVRTNWAGNVTYRAKTVHRPRTVEEAREIVRANGKIRALGTRHSFNTIADTPAAQISTEHLGEVIDLDEERGRVTVEGGIRYGELGPYLHERGYAIHNLASLPHISVAGACATATHGSGVENGNLATAVTGIEFVDGQGELRTLSREEDGEEFAGAVVGLGGLGLVTRVELEVVPTFSMYQHVYRELPLSALQARFDAIMADGYSVSLFTDWLDETVNQIWVKRVAEETEDPVDAPPTFHGARAAERHMHPIAALSAEPCTRQLGEVGPWFRRLPHFRLDFTPSSGDELQTEYLIDAERAPEAIAALYAMGEEIVPHLLITEIRTIAEDDLWMSTAHGRTSVAIHFTWKPDWQSVGALLPKIEEVLAPHGARPHWGKLFTMPAPRLAERYERLADFRGLLEKYDPDGTFRNSFLGEHVLGAS